MSNGCKKGAPGQEGELSWLLASRDVLTVSHPVILCNNNVLRTGKGAPCPPGGGWQRSHQWVGRYWVSGLEAGFWGVSRRLLMYGHQTDSDWSNMASTMTQMSIEVQETTITIFPGVHRVTVLLWFPFGSQITDGLARPLQDTRLYERTLLVFHRGLKLCTYFIVGWLILVFS